MFRCQYRIYAADVTLRGQHA